MFQAAENASRCFSIFYWIKREIYVAHSTPIFNLYKNTVKYTLSHKIKSGFVKLESPLHGRINKSMKTKFTVDTTMETSGVNYQAGVNPFLLHEYLS